MSVDSGNAARHKRYETFVVRLWVDSDAGFEHGEIRHIASNAQIRFRELARAVQFGRALGGRRYRPARGMWTCCRPGR